MGIVKRHWQLIAGIIILFLLVAALFALSVKRTGGRLIYFLDDPYIHMALAKNISEHGVWGVTKYEFSSSSSSPLWTVILASAYLLFGVNELAPFVLNLIIGSFLIFCVHALLKRFETRPALAFVVLLAVIFLAPVPPLVFFGLEHILQILIDVLFAYLAAKFLSDEKPPAKKYISLLALAPFVTTVRYEGMFLVFVVCVLFAFRRRFLQAILLGALGALPIAIYGLISLSKGWYFLPNPVLIKGYMPKLFSLAGIFELARYYEDVLAKSYHVAFLILAALVALISQLKRQDKKWESITIMNVIFIATALLHLQFARSSIRGIRYDAYLVALGLFALGVWLSQYIAQSPLKISKDSLPRCAAIAVFVLIAAFPVGWRGVRSFYNTPRATKNIYEQQYQMGLFLKKFYQGASVAVNDIGAVNFLADIKCLDLWGLADFDVAKLRRQGRYDAQKIYELAKQKDVKIAIVYENWFASLPKEWVKVGQWTVSDNVVLGGETVSFFAVGVNRAGSLIANLKEFAPYLPKDVVQSGVYAE